MQVEEQGSVVAVGVLVQEQLAVGAAERSGAWMGKPVSACKLEPWLGRWVRRTGESTGLPAF